MFVILCVLSRVVIDMFFFFKQKTAYEMRISDWSSDVCSSDLLHQLKPCRLDMNRNRRGQWLPTPFGDHVIALDGLAAPASVQRPGDVVGAAVGPVRAAVDRDDQRLQAFAIIDLPDDLGSLLCGQRSEEHTSELQSLMRISYAVFFLKKKTKNTDQSI